MLWRWMVEPGSLLRGIDEAVRAGEDAAVAGRGAGKEFVQLFLGEHHVEKFFKQALF